jgi:dienelactone hydrolase
MQNTSPLKRWNYVSILFFMALFASLNASAQLTSKANSNVSQPEIIYYTSDSLKLKAYIYKPEGKGPFPVFMWNHGSEKYPEDSIAFIYSYWVNKGYVVFMPIRSGQSDNPGEYICDEEKQIKRRKETAQLQFKQIYALHKKANNDVIAALKWIKKQHYIDKKNIIMGGGGYGGIQVLLTAAKDGESSLGVKSFISWAPASAIWNTLWADTLVSAIHKAKRPIFLLQAHNDFSLSPSEVLGPLLTKKGFPNRNKIFPDHEAPDGYGTQISLTGTIKSDGIYLGFYADSKVWDTEVMEYLKDCGVKRKK